MTNHANAKDIVAVLFEPDNETGLTDVFVVYGDKKRQVALVNAGLVATTARRVELSKWIMDEVASGHAKYIASSEGGVTGDFSPAQSN